jgi:hypothetical protein
MRESNRARIKFTPTGRGAKILDIVFENHDSLEEFARAAGVSATTVKRVCSSDEPIDMRESKVKGFERAGVPRDLLPLPVAE